MCFLVGSCYQDPLPQILGHASPTWQEGFYSWTSQWHAHPRGPRPPLLGGLPLSLWQPSQGWATLHPHHLIHLAALLGLEEGRWLGEKGKRWLRDLEVKWTLTTTHSVSLTCACNRYRCVHTLSSCTRGLQSCLRNETYLWEPMTQWCQYIIVNTLCSVM